MSVFGKIGQFPLRWSDAFTLNDNFKGSLALNPFQSFFSTLRFRDTKPDPKKLRQYYPAMAAYLGVQKPDSNNFNFDRYYSFDTSFPDKPNVVLVICESFSMYKSTMSGNPLNTTPYFHQLCKNGVFFDRCFTPAYPTARGVWATVTGIPDVLGDNNRTASRNPEVVDQRTIINDFKGYEKFYFLGGDPTWANIKGLLMNNIDSLHMFSQENFKAKKVDVWGIADKNLLLEANGILSEQKKPFFAIIQTADNHRPYTIPEEDLSVFKKVTYPDDSLYKYGFSNNDELNAFRYTDFGFMTFIEAAKKEKYFDNTLFIFVGDHGLPGNAENIYPKVWTTASLTREHVPLLFYAPRILSPKSIHSVCSQIDILPSAASALKVPYHNSTLGRNLFDSTATTNYAFVIGHEENTIGTITDSYYYIKNYKSGKEELLSMTNNDPVSSSGSTDSIKNDLAKFTEGFYLTSKYMLFHNKRK